MDSIVRETTGGLTISYGWWLGCAWWEFYAVHYGDC